MVNLLSSPLSSPPPNSYTFDRFGNAFRPGEVVHVSTLPLLIAIIPTWIVAVALVIIHARKCCCSGEKEDAGAITVARPQEPGGELARVGGRRSLGRSERAVRQLFRIIEEGEDDAEEDGDEGSGKGCCKSLVLRRWWRSMTE